MNRELRIAVVTVPTAGTPITNVAPFNNNGTRFTPECTITALGTNTDNMKVGGSDFATNRFKTLAPLQSTTFKAPENSVIDMSLLTFDAIVSGESVEVSYTIPAPAYQ